MHISHSINWYGLYTLFSKEVWRFMKVAVQTILTPVITDLLYLLVFSSVLAQHVKIFNLDYTAFLIPGLMMMSILQNAFANSSSSVFQSKMTGNLIFMLLAPLSSLEVYIAFIAAAVVRGLIVGLGVWLAALWFAVVTPAHFFLVLFFAIVSSMALGALGLIAGLWAEKWDHVAAFQNFVILPLSFLSGAFYSVQDLPPFWHTISYFNPFFYMINGFRYAFFGIAETSIFTSLIISSIFTLIVSIICLWILQIGYKIRN